MASSIYVASTKELSGKTLLTLSLGLEAKSQGLKVGYFKPIGQGSKINDQGQVIDEDVETMREILELEEDMETLCPVKISRPESLQDCTGKRKEDIHQRIIDSYQQLSEGKDLVLIEGTDTLWTGSFLGLSSPNIARELSSKMVIVAAGEDDSAVDDLIHADEYCTHHEISTSGVILNRVPSDRMERSKTSMRACLERHGLDVLGVVPEDRDVSALSVREICDALGGKVLAGEEGLDRTIRNYLVGAMTMESAMKYFRRTTDKLVVTGGDRTDIILAAMEAGASALILTGNLYPTIKILPRADDKRIPIIMVPQDTYATLNLVQKTIGKIKPSDTRRIDKAREVFGSQVDWQELLG